MNINLFGTDGIRNIVGQFPFELPALISLGSAIGRWINLTIRTDAHVLIGHDTRISCSMIKSALKTGLLLNKHTIHDAEVVPTPMVCLLTQHKKFDVGIIISASHNPYQDNGIKIVTQKGKITVDDEQCIQNTFLEHLKNPDFSYTTLGSENKYNIALESYLALLNNYFTKDFLTGVKIVLDCAHGASSSIAPYIFKFYGAEVIAINNHPNGTNINRDCGSLVPTKMQSAVVNHAAHVGFAFDGDADRVIACNSKGIIKDGDDILSLLSTHPAYLQQPGIVGTVMTNQGLIDSLAKKNMFVSRASVGDKYVAQLLNVNNLLLGGEPSGHIIMKDFMNSGDGIFTALRVMQTIILNKNWSLDSFVRYPQLLVNMPVLKKLNLLSGHVSEIISAYEKKLTSGRLIVRYSGTENLLRIMVENIYLDEAQQVLTDLAHDLEKEHSL